ncbi:hypothetical protein TNCV_244861 [Trichonephila clavipes]|uniref:Uncharacterized protein n=1 Tax=Trichonephila clavipes TaxID=2585209 RepID=A0A8X6RQ11_TRICX|nr:hypothetical protein TNCV_244861 [Trichonephila clavipes]
MTGTGLYQGIPGRISEGAKLGYGQVANVSSVIVSDAYSGRKGGSELMDSAVFDLQDIMPGKGGFFHGMGNF